MIIFPVFVIFCVSINLMLFWFLQMLFEVVACAVVFQFIPELNEGEENGRVPSYYDKLNSWVRYILLITNFSIFNL